MSFGTQKMISLIQMFELHLINLVFYLFFSFRQTRVKVNVTYNSENATVTYKNKVYFYFDPELSNGSLSDNVTSINTIAAVSRKTVQF